MSTLLHIHSRHSFSKINKEEGRSKEMSGEYSSVTILFHILSKAKSVDICTSDSTPEFIGMIFHIVDN